MWSSRAVRSISPSYFANNDRPGIMFATAAQRLMALYGVKPGTRAVIATSNRFGYEAAHDLLDAGIAVAAIADLNATPDILLADAARARGIRVIPGATLVDAKGKTQVDRVAVATITGPGETSDRLEWIHCDLVLMSAGFSPAVNLASHAGAKIGYDARLNMHRVTTCPDGLSVAGALARAVVGRQGRGSRAGDGRQGGGSRSRRTCDRGARRL